MLEASRERAAVAVGVAAAVTLSTGATLKGECFGYDHHLWRSRLCYTDIQPLYRQRGIDHHVFPYVHATLSPTGVGRHGFNEYPVLTGIFMWATGLPVSTASAYLTITIALLAIAAVATTFLLWGTAGSRTLYWAASPLLALYAFHNWDLLAVTAAVAGISLWHAGRSRWAAFAFAIGAGFKLYPALFIIPLVMERFVRRRPRDALGVGAAGVGGLALINLPFILVNTHGWWATYRFHAQRAPATTGAFWAVIDSHISTTAENRLSLVTLAAALIAITAALLRARRGTTFPVVEWCAAATAAFIVLNKVSSPQYVLWILPFLALVPAHRAWWWLLSAVAIVRYAALFGVNVVGFGTHTADRVGRDAIVAQAIVLALYACDVVRCAERPGVHPDPARTPDALAPPASIA